MANLISKIKTPNNVTYDLQDKVSTFGGTNLLSKCDWKNFGLTSFGTIDSASGVEIISNNKLKIYANMSVNQDRWKTNSLINTIPIGIQTICSFYVYENTLNSNFKYTVMGGNDDDTVSSGWGQNLDVGFTGFHSRILPAWTEKISQVFIHFDTRNNNSGYIIIGPVKLEIGNKPTDWTPAPQDLVLYSDESLIFFQ